MQETLEVAPDRLQAKKLLADIQRRAPEIVHSVLGLPPLKDVSVPHDRLQSQWYAAIVEGVHPKDQAYDWSVYSDPEYPYLMLDCFKGWSKWSVKNAVQFYQDTGLTPPSTIIDIFAGIGQSSIYLAKMFPNATVYYHNTDESQTKVFKALMKEFGVKNAKIVTKPRSADLIFAVEAMEHLLDPLEFLRPLLKDAKVYVDASSFTIDSIGHFPTYMEGDKVLERKEFKRRFFKAVREEGLISSFSKENFLRDRFYNGRPNVFVRPSACGGNSVG